MRLNDTLRKNKKNFIIYGILWLISVIVFVMPISAGIIDATVEGKFDFAEFMTIVFKYITQPFSSFGKTFSATYFSGFINILWKYSIVFVIITIIGILKNKSKGEYENIEHGSSDWSKNGEQYKILSNRKGILLAEDNYLPLDKRGNTNVLVVGRFRFW